MVAAWIGAAYWFTASTSFANPAITIARSLSDTFSGIRRADVPGFIIAQLAGALLALLVAGPLFRTESSTSIARKTAGPTSPDSLASRPDHS
jgi:glycerol uptake facilitator-like aquaporin